MTTDEINTDAARPDYPTHALLGNVTAARGTVLGFYYSRAEALDGRTAPTERVVSIIDPELGQASLRIGQRIHIERETLLAVPEIVHERIKIARCYYVDAPKKGT
jgi:hypothetical protein